MHVNHSMACCVALAIKTPLGMVIHAGDFKIDTTPVGCEMTDLTRFGELGRPIAGALKRLYQCQKAATTSERTVGAALETFESCNKNVSQPLLRVQGSADY